MATNLFLMEDEGGTFNIISPHTLAAGIQSQTRKGDQLFTDFMINAGSDGVVIRIPGPPEHIFDVLKRQNVYRRADWPKAIITNA